VADCPGRCQTVVKPGTIGASRAECPQRGENVADVIVRQAHELTLEEVRERILGFEELMGKYGVKAHWDGSAAKLKGTGVSGSIEVSDTEVVITIELGMMARAVGVDPVRLKASIVKRLGPALTGA
jgi:putative polyhydroxyalkanoate system protein